MKLDTIPLVISAVSASLIIVDVMLYNDNFLTRNEAILVFVILYTISIGLPIFTKCDKKNDI